MNPLLIAALVAGVGVGAVALKKSSTTPPAAPLPGTALDPGMDHYTGAVVAKALSVETDPAILNQLAQDLSAAGFVNSAKAVSARAVALKNNLQSSSKGS